MDFGFPMPPRGPMATPENIATLAQQGEAMGFSIIAVTDHIIFPKSIQSPYPGGASGQYYAAGESQGEYLEPLALLSFLADGCIVALSLAAAESLGRMAFPDHPQLWRAASREAAGSRAIVGRVVGEEDGDLLIMANPFAPDEKTRVKISAVKSRKPYPISMMPPGLINSLNEDELKDLLAYILSGANESDAMFKK